MERKDPETEEAALEEEPIPRLWPENFPAQEIIWDMKKCGLPRPPEIPSELWNNIQEITHSHEAIADLMLKGIPKFQIADRIGCTKEHIYNVTRTPTFDEYYQKRRRAHELVISKESLTQHYERAVDTLVEVMLSDTEKGTTKADVAKYIVDHSVGKAKQEVHVQTHSSSLILMKIEELRKSSSPGNLPKLLAKPVSPFDDLLNEIIPDGYKVGSTNGKAEEPESEP